MNKKISILIFCLALLIILVSTSAIFAQENNQEIQEVVFYPGSHMKIKYINASTINIHLGDSFRNVTNVLGLPNHRDKEDNCITYWYLIQNRNNYYQYFFVFSFNKRGEVILIANNSNNRKIGTNRNIKIFDHPSALRETYGNKYVDNKTENRDKNSYQIEYQSLGLGTVIKKTTSYVHIYECNTIVFYFSSVEGIATFYIFPPEI